MSDTDWGTPSAPRDGDRQAALGTGETVTVPRPSARLGARLLDKAIIFGSMLPVLFLLAVSDGVALLFLLWGLAAVLYEPVLIARRGQTFGKQIVGIKVVNAATGGLPRAGKSIGRWLIPVLCGIIPFGSLVCYASLLWNDQRQGWHDLAAGTLVVRA